MARPLRIQYPGAVYHVTGRGNERKAIFRDDVDRERFLDTLAGVNRRYHFICHAYCLMNNHYHLVLETPEGNLSKGMRNLNGVYTQAFNRRHRRPGHLLQGRYKAILVQKESHLLEVCRYVVLNPVRANATSSPEVWRWSSYRATAGRAKPHPCLTVAWVLESFGRRRTKARTAYRAFVREGMGRESIWTELQGQSLLGKADFVERFQAYAKGRQRDLEIPRMQRHLGRPALGTLFSARVRKMKAKRDEAIRKAVDEHGYSQKEISEHLGLHYSTISRLVSAGEHGHQK